ncbi:MAG: HD domain-containing protein [Planctomycetes bacterium]|nr:HD domain-containing protein [Planctomycetota bacterium]
MHAPQQSTPAFAVDKHLSTGAAAAPAAPQSVLPAARVLIVDPQRVLREPLTAALVGMNIAPLGSRPGAANGTAQAAPATGLGNSPAMACVDGFAQAETIVAGGLARGEAYSVVFVHVPLHRAFDVLQSVRQLWQIDSDLQMVLCAESHAEIETLIGQLLGDTDRLLLLRLPLAAIEARQGLSALLCKWHTARDVRRGIQGLLRVVEQQTQEVVATRDLSMFAMAKLAESRDPETGQHLERMREYSQMLAIQLSNEGPYADLIDAQFLQDLYRSTPLHDIGKVAIPDNILLKPGKLTPSEFDIMKGHALIGAETLEDVVRHSSSGSFMRMAADIAKYHHERFNGNGYPHGLRGAEIPLAARIVALADVFDALTSPRVYKAAFDPEVARRMIEAECGQHFDPVVVEAFRVCYPQFLPLIPQRNDAALHAPVH